MDRRSQNTLGRVEQNDAALSKLRIGGPQSDGVFYSSNGDDYSRLGLGAAILVILIWKH